MTFVIAAPEMMTAAATDLSIIDADLSHAHSAAARATVALVPAAADEVSVGIAHLFSEHAEDFHGLAGRAAAFHGQFAQNLKAGAASYASFEDAIAPFLRPDSVLAELVYGLLEPAVGSALLEKYPPLMNVYDILVNAVFGLLAMPLVAVAAVLIGGLIVLGAFGGVIGWLLHGMQG
jgi:hypothetical protein